MKIGNLLEVYDMRDDEATIRLGKVIEINDVGNEKWIHTNRGYTLVITEKKVKKK